ncbi:hypothetical protein HPK19_07545 [Arthrobacter citreus]|nr:hypothetical protein HPK19_07545 [Arthrobacter citreus]
MKDETRAGIAYISLRLATGTSKNDVYDYNSGRYISINGEVTSQRVNVYDYDVGCFISGNGNNDKFNLYHYGVNQFIDLKKLGKNKFGGYDYDENNHFECTVSGNSVSVYDYEKGTFFEYSF